MTLYVLPSVAGGAAVAKIPLPIQGRHLIRRTGLLERLAVVGDDVPLVVFTAPAGYGKTTALSQWAAVDGRWFGWVTLTEADSDPMRLAGHVALALNRLIALDPAVLRSMAAGDGLHARALPHLLASLHHRSPRAVLVLDDVHELRTVTALNFIRALAAGVPPGFHLAIGSRVSLGLGSLRGERRCVEFGADDLAFTDDEARQVLANAGVVCSDQEVAALVLRTRGWPAAVYLSALVNHAAPGEEVRVQLRAAGWDGQGGRATDAAVHLFKNHHRAAAVSAPVADGGSYPAMAGHMALSTAEMRVLELMPTHLSLSEIGDQLHTSRNTVKSHVAAVYRKLGCSTRTEVVGRGRELGLLEP
jgi:ATP/maltotriose-dependent transcriptional regulator MalT